MVTVGQIVDEVEKIVPRNIGLPDDPAGMQVGSRDWQVQKIMLAVDADGSTVRQAVHGGAGLLLTHHPLFHQPVGKVDLQTPIGRTIGLCLENRIAVYSAHTNLDAAANGINASLADALEIADRHVLLPTDPAQVKLVTFVPGESLKDVRGSLFRSGAGTVGAYSNCSFVTSGEGTFLGGEGAEPSVGQPGRQESVAEVRLEVVLKRDDLDSALVALRAAHPYEEPVVDAYDLLPTSSRVGIGLIGDLPAKMSVEDLVKRLTGLWNIRCARFIGDPPGPLQKVALCAGSGASLLQPAAAGGAELYITGDMKYHDARLAQQVGLPVLDLGHFGPERMGLERFGELLRGSLQELDKNIGVLFAKEEDPFQQI